jgi:hypothetical protein
MVGRRPPDLAPNSRPGPGGAKRTGPEVDPLTGKHRRDAARTEPARAPGPIGITNSRTHIEHLMSREAVEHRHAGRYLASLGQRVLLAAILTAPERRRRLIRAGGAR